MKSVENKLEKCLFFSFCFMGVSRNCWSDA